MKKMLKRWLIPISAAMALFVTGTVFAADTVNIKVDNTRGGYIEVYYWSDNDKTVYLPIGETSKVPKGKTLRINSYISSNEEEKTKIEKYIEISEKYINEKIPEIEEVVDVVSKDLKNPVSSKGLYNAIQTSVVNISTGLPFVAVASSEAPKAIKSVCKFVCDGTDDNIEIQNAIDSLA